MSEFQKQKMPYMYNINKHLLHLKLTKITPYAAQEKFPRKINKAILGCVPSARKPSAVTQLASEYIAIAIRAKLEFSNIYK